MPLEKTGQPAPRQEPEQVTESNAISTQLTKAVLSPQLEFVKDIISSTNDTLEQQRLTTKHESSIHTPLTSDQFDTGSILDLSNEEQEYLDVQSNTEDGFVKKSTSLMTLL